MMLLAVPDVHETIELEYSVGHKRQKMRQIAVDMNGCRQADGRRKRFATYYVLCVYIFLTYRQVPKGDEGGWWRSDVSRVSECIFRVLL